MNALERRGIEFTNDSGMGERLLVEKAAEFARLAAQVQNESER